MGQRRKARTTHDAPTCSSADVNELAEKRLNGREITHVTSAARAMVAFDRTMVNVTYLGEAIGLNQQFQADFKGAGYLGNQRSHPWAVDMKWI